MHADLSFEQAPPISVPFRFLLTAPWFAVAAGLLLAWQGPQAILSRWSAGALAATHLMVAGFMLQAMSGALFQFVPVAAGGNVWRPRLVAGVVHVALSWAAILLAVGFLSANDSGLRFAAGLFVVAVAVLAAAIGTALLRTPARGATVRALRLAVGGLCVTVMLGATLAEGLAGAHAWPLADIVDVHAAWGFVGWALMLLVGVSYLVVPMFQLTPSYPRRFADAFPYALLAAVILLSRQLLAADTGWNRLAWLSCLMLAAGYALVTLFLQSRRRRKIPDVTLSFFRFAMICFFTAFVSAAAVAAIPGLGEHPRVLWWFGILLVPGAFMAAINGMLYRIVPFLNWLHLQRLMGPGMLPPSVRDMIAEARMRGQMVVHFAAVGLLLAAVIWPPLAQPAGAALAVSSAWLGWNLIAALRVYRRVKAGISATVADPAG